MTIDEGFLKLLSELQEASCAVKYDLRGVLSQDEENELFYTLQSIRFRVIEIAKHHKV